VKHRNKNCFIRLEQRLHFKRGRQSLQMFWCRHNILRLEKKSSL